MNIDISIKRPAKIIDMNGNKLDVYASILDILEVFFYYGFPKMSFEALNHFLTLDILSKYNGDNVYWRVTRYAKFLYHSFPPIFDSNILNNMLKLAYSANLLERDEDGYYVTENGKSVMKKEILHKESSYHSLLLDDCLCEIFDEYLIKNMPKTDNTFYTRMELLNIIKTKHQELEINPWEPSDYCYNRWNKDLNNFISHLHIFEYIDRGKYRILGSQYCYDGNIFYGEKIIGEWEKGQLKWFNPYSK